MKRQFESSVPIQTDRLLIPVYIFEGECQLKRADLGKDKTSTWTKYMEEQLKEKLKDLSPKNLVPKINSQFKKNIPKMFGKTTYEIDKICDQVC